jgi:hypothetical protein
LEVKNAAKYKNWRIRAELHKQIERASVDESAPMYALAEKAWLAYVNGGVQPEASLPEQLHPSDPTVMPGTPDERRLVSKLLRILRDKHTLPRDLALIEGFLDNYLYETRSSASKSHAKSDTKRA